MVRSLDGVEWCGCVGGGCNECGSLVECVLLDGERGYVFLRFMVSVVVDPG